DDEPVDLVVDALIGYSLKGAPRGPALELIQWANARQAPVLSLDIPSGVDATSGESAGEYIDAAATLTLALPKTGLIPEKTGTLQLVDLGIPGAVYRQLGIEYTTPFENKYRIALRPAP
ncbi:MAG TPA: NAD(P)H-hydrate epimerase, partial [bacterium]|nr:NAD(P)H-hydrate epimerase [bacterium]